MDVIKKSMSVGLFSVMEKFFVMSNDVKSSGQDIAVVDENLPENSLHEAGNKTTMKCGNYM